MQLDVFNQRTWLDIEKKIYEELYPDSARVSVFAGPVEAPSDVAYRGNWIPRTFWLVAFYQDPQSPAVPRVVAFLADQLRDRLWKRSGVLAEDFARRPASKPGRGGADRESVIPHPEASLKVSFGAREK